MIPCSPIEIRCCDLQGILRNNPPNLAGFGAPTRPKLAKFPTFSLRSREFATESRSHQTASSTSQSEQNALSPKPGPLPGLLNAREILIANCHFEIRANPYRCSRRAPQVVSAGSRAAESAREIIPHRAAG